MKIINTLKFVVEEEYKVSDGYGGTENKIQRNAYSKQNFINYLYEKLKSKYQNRYLCVTNEVMVGTKFLIFKKFKYVAVIDCDSEAQLVLACEYLNLRNINFKIIESSPNRFWIIADKSGSYEEISKFISSVPGHDINWYSMCINRHNFYIRAHSKLNKDQIFSNIVPVFQDTHDLKDPIVFKWYKDFKHYFENDWPRLYKAYTMWNAIENNDITNLVSSPKF